MQSPFLELQPRTCSLFSVSELRETRHLRSDHLENLTCGCLYKHSCGKILHFETLILQSTGISSRDTEGSGGLWVEANPADTTLLPDA